MDPCFQGSKDSLFKERFWIAKKLLNYFFIFLVLLFIFVLLDPSCLDSTILKLSFLWVVALLFGFTTTLWTRIHLELPCLVEDTRLTMISSLKRDTTCVFRFQPKQSSQVQTGTKYALISCRSSICKFLVSVESGTIRGYSH